MRGKIVIPPEVWERLEAGGASGSGHLRQRVNTQAPVDVYVAVERPSGSRVLALGFDQPPHISLAHEVRLRGLRVSEARYRFLRQAQRTTSCSASWLTILSPCSTERQLGTRHPTLWLHGWSRGIDSWNMQGRPGFRLRPPQDSTGSSGAFAI
jgi:hypothetical protein